MEIDSTSLLLGVIVAFIFLLLISIAAGWSLYQHARIQRKRRMEANQSSSAQAISSLRLDPEESNGIAPLDSIKIRWSNNSSHESVSRSIQWGAVQDDRIWTPITPDSSATKDEDRIKCPICRDDIENNLTKTHQCTACQTLYHYQCWQEHDECPICHVG